MKVDVGWRVLSRSTQVAAAVTVDGGGVNVGLRSALRKSSPALASFFKHILFSLAVIPSLALAPLSCVFM